MAFAADSDAKRAQKALLDGGFKEADVTHYNKGEVLSEFEESEEQAIGPLQIGQDVAKVEEFLSLAKDGCGFLVVHAPKGEQSKLAVSIANTYGLKFAEKYNWLTIEELV